MTKNVDCTVIGEAIVDIIIPVQSFNQFNAGLFGGILNSHCTIASGGTANVAAGLATLGGNSAFIGKVGADCFGSFFRKDLEDADVMSNISVSKTEKTGVAITISSIRDKERFFIVDRGANAQLLPGDVDYDLARKSGAIYFTGLSFQDPNVSRVVLSFVEEAAAEGKTVVFNPGAYNIAASCRTAIIGAVKDYVDIIILNRVEGQSLSHSQEDEKIVEFLLSLGVNTVVLTKGENGSIISTTSYTHFIEIDPIDAVDTTGAGDAYASGIIYGIARAWDLERAGRFASLVARAVVGKHGSRFNPRDIQPV
ncbi:MAG: carbohydrate kinase family protein [Halobacteriota archaeon]